MEQLEIEYWDMDIWNVNEFRVWWSPNLVIVRSPSYLKQKDL